MSRLTVVNVRVSDWHVEGDAVEVFNPEDGHSSTRLPAHNWVVMAETTDGALWAIGNFPYTDRGADLATGLCEAVRAKGDLDPDRWHFMRHVYGSAAREYELLEAEYLERHGQGPR